MTKKEKPIVLEPVKSDAITMCPHCHSDQIWRIQRSLPEMIACFLSDGKFVARKYRCQACRNTTLLHRREPQQANTCSINENVIEGYVYCDKCQGQKMQVDKLSVAEEVRWETQTGKRALRKVTCLNCRNQTLIDSEEFDLFCQQDF